MHTEVIEPKGTRKRKRGPYSVQKRSGNEPSNDPIWGPRMGKALRRIYALDCPLTAEQATAVVCSALGVTKGDIVAGHTLAMVEGMGLIIWDGSHWTIAPKANPEDRASERRPMADPWQNIGAQQWRSTKDPIDHRPLDVSSSGHTLGTSIVMGAWGSSDVTTRYGLLDTTARRARSVDNSGSSRAIDDRAF